MSLQLLAAGLPISNLLRFVLISYAACCGGVGFSSVVLPYIAACCLSLCPQAPKIHV